jgi:hypothetical protein
MICRSSPPAPTYAHARSPNRHVSLRSPLNCRTIYNMCTQKPPHDYSQQLYNKYRVAFDQYLASTVRFL